MRLIIAGSRDIYLPNRCPDEHNLYDLIDSCALIFKGCYPRTVLCGMTRGMDMAGRTWALSKGIYVPEYHADWETHGKAAGPIRNQEMVDNADALLVIRYPDSRGSADVLRRARKAELQVVDVVLPRPASGKREEVR